MLIHDGVRPLITETTITDNIRKVEECGSCITVVPATETFVVKQADGNFEIPRRSDCVLARAPQSFYLKDIIEAHRRCQKEGLSDFIDSCSMMQYYGHKLYLIDGPQENIKITTPDDFYTMRALLDAKEEAQIFGFEAEDK